MKLTYLVTVEVDEEASADPAFTQRQTAQMLQTELKTYLESLDARVGPATVVHLEDDIRVKLLSMQQVKHESFHAGEMWMFEDDTTVLVVEDITEAADDE